MSYIAFQIKQNQIKIISNPSAISIIRTLAHALLSKSNKIKEKQTAIHPQFRPSTKPNHIKYFARENIFIVNLIKYYLPIRSRSEDSVMKTFFRMVGCCCEDDYQEIVWFELHKGETQQCDCGNYFKLIDYDPLDPNIKPKYGMGFGSGLSSIYY